MNELIEGPISLMYKIVSVMLSVVTSTVSFAATPPPMPQELADYEEYGIFTYYPSVPEALFLEGESIPPNHGLELRKALNELNKVTTIVLDSPGGDVYSALNMAGVIHDRSISTYVPANGNCASACSFMFLAGIDRFSDGKLGVHQFAPTKDRKENRSTTISQAQFTMSDLYAVLSPFEVPDFVIVKMFDTPADNMYYFTNRQLRKINRGEESSILDQVDNLMNIRDKFVVELADYLELEKKKNIQPVVTIKKPVQPSHVIKSDPLLAEIQRLLNLHGCNAGIADGVMGAKTREAMLRFAQATGNNIRVWGTRKQQIEGLKETPYSACIEIKKVTPKPAESQTSTTTKLSPNTSSYAKVSSREKLWGTWQAKQTCGNEVKRMEIRLLGGASQSFENSYTYNLESYSEEIVEVKVKKFLFTETKKEKRLVLIGKGTVTERLNDLVFAITQISSGKNGPSTNGRASINSARNFINAKTENCYYQLNRNN